MKDSERGPQHLTKPRLTVFFEEWIKDKLEFDNILVPPENLPLSQEDEDDLIPEQSAFGIARLQKPKHPQWQDLGLKETFLQGPSKPTSGGDQTLLQSDSFASVSRPAQQNRTSSIAPR